MSIPHSVADASALAQEPGTVWLIGAVAGRPELLLADARAALRDADAVIYDAAIPAEVVALIGRYGEPARPRAGAIRRSIALARDGWRVVRLVRGDPLRSKESGAEMRALAEASIPFRMFPLGHRLLTTAAGTTTERRAPPLGFSMAGLAG